MAEEVATIKPQLPATYSSNKLSDYEKIALAFRTKTLPKHIKSEEMAFVICSYGKEWGLSLWESLKGVYTLGDANLTPCLTASSLHTLIRRAGHHFEIERDYAPLYITDDPRHSYLFGNIVLDKDGKKTYVPLNPQDPQGQPDRITTLACYSTHGQEFAKRFNKEPKPEYISFRLSDALRAGLLSKDVWAKWTPNMLFARTLSEANRKVFQVCPNVYTVEELDDKEEYSEASIVMVE